MRLLFSVSVLSCLLAILAAFAAERLSQPIWFIDEHTGLLLVHNPGIAFGMHIPSPFQELLILVALVAVIAAAIRSTSALQHTAFGLIIGGAIANLVDRFADGFVTDVFKVGSFPVFNLADSCITVGAVLLIAQALLQRKGRGE